MRKRVYFIDAGEQSIKTLIKYFHIMDPEIISDMIWDENDPDIVFFSYSIYENEKCFETLKRLYRNPYRVYVFYAYQLMEPDLNICDYAIGYRYDFLGDGRHFRIPTMIADGTYNGYSIPKRNGILEEDARKQFDDRNFCNFIYSNPYATPKREALFNALSKYKHVDALGAVLHNVEEPINRGGEDWFRDSIHKKEKYRFSITVENGVYGGYTCEKLLTSLCAHTIPIYYGNPEVNREFNKNALINVHDYDTFEELIEVVKRIDMDEGLWVKMICEPWQTEEQIRFCQKMMKDYQSMLHKVFSESCEQAIRRPVGSFMMQYYQNFFYGDFYKSFSNKIKRAISSRYFGWIKKEKYRPWPLDQLYMKGIF